MVTADRGIHLDRESVRARPERAWPAILGNAMSAKTTSQKPKRKKSKTGSQPAYAASPVSMAARNLINMAVVFAASGTVLLGLLAAKRF